MNLALIPKVDKIMLFLEKEEFNAPLLAESAKE